MIPFYLSTVTAGFFTFFFDFSMELTPHILYDTVLYDVMELITPNGGIS